MDKIRICQTWMIISYQHKKSKLPDIVLYITALHAASKALATTKSMNSTNLALRKISGPLELYITMEMKFTVIGTIIKPGMNLSQYWDKMVLLCLFGRGYITLKPIISMCNHQIQINFSKKNCQIWTVHWYNTWKKRR